MSFSRVDPTRPRGRTASGTRRSGRRIVHRDGSRRTDRGRDRRIPRLDAEDRATPRPVPAGRANQPMPARDVSSEEVWRQGRNQPAGSNRRRNYGARFRGRSNRGQKKSGPDGPDARINSSERIALAVEDNLRRPAPASVVTHGRAGSVFSIAPLPMVMPISRTVMVPPANRANSESCRPHRAPAMPRPNRATIRPICPRDGQRVDARHQAIQAEPQDAADLEQDDQDLEDGTDRADGTRRPYRLLPWFLRGRLAMGVKSGNLENSFPLRRAEDSSSPRRAYSGPSRRNGRKNRRPR